MRRRRRLMLLWVAAVACLCLCMGIHARLLVSRALEGSGDVVAHIASDTQLQEALADQHVHMIVLEQDIRLQAPTWSQASYRLQRNLTITSDPPFRKLDCAFLGSGQILMAPGEWMNISGIVLENSRYGAGIQLDLMAPSPGSILIYWNAVVVRSTCAYLGGEPEAIAVQPRLPGFPGNQSARYMGSACVRGSCSSQTIVYEDFAKMGASSSESAAGDYSMVMHNTTKLCQAFAPSCARAYDVDVCMKSALDQVQTTASTPGQLAAAEAAAASAAAVHRRNTVIGAVLGSVTSAALLLGLFLLLVRHALRRRVAAKAGAGAGFGRKDRLPDVEASAIVSGRPREEGSVQVPGKDVEGGLPNIDVAVTVSTSSFGTPLRVKKVDPLFASDSPSQLQNSWEVVAWKTSSQFQQPLVRQHSGPAALDSTAVMPQSGSPSSGSAGRQSSYDLMMQGSAGVNLQLASDRISLGVLLGAGSFGRVYKGTWRGIPVAVKVVHHSQAATSTVANEVDLMMNFRHPNVVHAHHFVTWRRRNSSFPSSDGQHEGQQHDELPQGHVVTHWESPWVEDEAASAVPGDAGSSYVEDIQTWIVQEFCDAGSLSDYSLAHGVGQDRRLPEGHAMLRLLFRLREVADGMSYLHDMASVVHGDLKASNILLSVAPTAPYGRTAKVTDFGLSRVHAVGQTHRSTQSLGTISHMAPEMLRFGKASAAADVYSFGIMMWELLTGQVAYLGMQLAAVISNVVLQGHRPPIPEGASEDYCLLMMSCWHPQPTERPDFKQILSCINIMITSRQQDLAEAATSSSHCQVSHPSSSTLQSSSSHSAAAGPGRSSISGSHLPCGPQPICRNSGEFEMKRGGSSRLTA